MKALKVDFRVKNVVPEVLLDYLYVLIQQDEMICGIGLTPEKLGAGEVQDIACETVFGTAIHRVFGFKPVDTQLKVTRYENQIELAAA